MAWLGAGVEADGVAVPAHLRRSEEVVPHDHQRVGAGEALRRIAAGLRPALPARAAALLVEERNKREERQEPGPGPGQLQEEEGHGEGQEERQMGCPRQDESQDEEADEEDTNQMSMADGQFEAELPVRMQCFFDDELEVLRVRARMRQCPAHAFADCARVCHRTRPPIRTSPATTFPLRGFDAS